MTQLLLKALEQANLLKPLTKLVQALANKLNQVQLKRVMKQARKAQANHLRHQKLANQYQILTQVEVMKGYKLMNKMKQNNQ